MRMKVKSPDSAVHDAAREIAAASGTLVLENLRRFTLAIENPEPDVVSRLEAAGASVSPDYQYEPDSPEVAVH